jgi:DNA-binding NarL/FixJ family response regulator
MQESSRIRVVLVDDHPILRAGLRTLLEAELDIEVVGEAESGSDAVALVASLSPDVVLMDLTQPNMSGVEATKRILANDGAVKIVALTAHDDQAFARTLLEAGAMGYALKRTVCDELLRAVRVVALGGIYVDPSMGSLLQSNGLRRGAAGHVATLSEREAEVVRLIAEGHTSKEMAQALGLSPRTLETYKARAMTKLNLRTRAELIRYALRRGWLRDS